MTKKIQELTQEQEKAIINLWDNHPNDPPSLLELVKIAFPNVENADGRSKEGKAVKAFLAVQDLKARGSHQYKPKGLLELTVDREEFITNNVLTMKPLDIAKAAFNNDKLTTLSQEARTVIEYIKTLDPKLVYSQRDDNDETVDAYKAPKTFLTMVARINRYIADKINKDKMTGAQKREVNAIMGYLFTYRFNHQINTYQSETDRDLFESSFVRYTHNKSDLTQEEVDQYIVLCTEIVISSSIQETIQMMQLQIDQEIEGGNRIPMTLIEANNTARTEYNQCVNRQQKLLNDLKVKRSDRLSKQIRDNASILNLVQLWREEESRKKMIHLAELRKETLKKEIGKLTSMDEIKAKIFGISDEEVLNG
jgi:hypothetical protein